MRFAALVVASVLCLAVPACRSKTEPAPSAPPVTPPSLSLTGRVNEHHTRDLRGNGALAILEIGAGDNYFDPTYVVARPAAVVTLTVRNRGSRPHTWTTEAFDTGPIEAGETKTLRVVLPPQGQLRYFCRFHEAQGMQGAFST